jgi:hypothetical protein
VLSGQSLAATTNASNDKKPAFSANFRSNCSFFLESEKAI